MIDILTLKVSCENIVQIDVVDLLDHTDLLR